MTGKLAVRSLTAHPIRTAVLAAGFGLGVAVMAILLGVAEVVLDQAQSPALVGGGDVVLRLDSQVPARIVLSGPLQSERLRPRVRAVSPFHTSPLYLVGRTGTSRITARGGIPSLERAMGDKETSDVPRWRDLSTDVAWTQDSPAKVLRYIDRFHQIPDAPEWRDSWAEWLYFNGRSPEARFYLTFLVGPRAENGRRQAGVRLQLEREARPLQTFGAAAELSEEQAMRAPDLAIGSSWVRLEGTTYRIYLDLTDRQGRRLQGELTIAASPGRLVPPIEITGARGWRTGYVVPVTSGTLSGELRIDDESITLEGGTGYHDHNWGFWEGVSWQWGQVQHEDLSFIYGRVFPPREAADPDRMPGFVGALGPDGFLGYATNVQIGEVNDERGLPQTISVRARGSTLDLDLRFDVSSTVTTTMVAGPITNGLDFLQLRGTYTVVGRAADRDMHFTAAGVAETFRGQTR